MSNEQAKIELAKAAAYDEVAATVTALANGWRSAAASMVVVPMPGALVRKDGRIFKVTEHGQLDTLGNEGVISPGERDPQELVWLEYELVQDGDPGTDEMRKVGDELKAGLAEDDVGGAEALLLHDGMPAPREHHPFLSRAAPSAPHKPLPSFECSGKAQCSERVVADGGWCPACCKWLEEREKVAEADAAVAFVQKVRTAARACASTALRLNYGDEGLALMAAGFLWEEKPGQWERNGWAVWGTLDDKWFSRELGGDLGGSHETLEEAIAGCEAPA